MDDPTTMRRTVLSPSDPLHDTAAPTPFRGLLWATLFVTPLFLIPQCLDRYLAPRFLLLSAVLLAALLVYLKNLRTTPSEHTAHSIPITFFDGLLLIWYIWNLASITWAFSWSEAVFYAQKTALFLGTYVVLRWTFTGDVASIRKTLQRITIWLSWVGSGLVSGQLLYAGTRYGWNNDSLYDYASGVWGNKSLASEFLFFLLVFNVLFTVPPLYDLEKRTAKPRLFWLRIGLLLLLILLLQTRTAYLAVIAGAVVYCCVRATTEPAFRDIFFRKILPACALTLGLLAAVLSLKGKGSSLSERLNPMTYLESATANERRFVWYKTDLLNRDHYWLGVGDGSWKFWLPSKNIQGGYRQQEEDIVFTRAHNDYLEIRAETGMIGAVLFCSLFGAAFCAGIWSWKSGNGVRRYGADTEADGEPDSLAFRHDLLVLMVGLLGYCIIQFFDFPRERIEMQIVLAFFFAHLAWLSRKAWERLPVGSVKKTIPVFLLVAAAALLFNLVIGFYRVVGEIHAVRMFEAQSRSDFRSMATEVRASVNPFYEYDDAAVPLAWYQGIAVARLGDVPTSVGHFRDAYQLHPWSFQIIDFYAAALMKSGKYRDAIPLIESALRINPKFEEGKFNLAYTWAQLGDYAQAAAWLDRVDTIPKPQTAEQRRRNQAMVEKLLKAREALQEKMR